MIYKTLITALALFIVYTAIIIMVKPGNKPQNFEQRNIIKAQEYLYHTQGKKVVIVGSSLSGNMPLNDPSRFSILAFSALGPLDGLTIVKNAKKKPSIVLVEVNKCNHPANAGFIGKVFLPVFNEVRDRVPSLQEKFQPMNVLLPFLLKAYHSAAGIVGYDAANGSTVNDQPSDTKGLPAGKKVLRSPEVSEKQYSYWLNYFIKEYSTIPDEKYVDQNLKSLKECTDYLEKENVTVVFFEMPIDENLRILPWPVFLRNKVHQLYPENRYHYIKAPENITWYTTDGLHLDKASYKIYVKYFAQEVEKLLSKIK